jgi:hypothetical protein
MRTVWLQRALTQAEHLQMRNNGAPHQLRWWCSPTSTYFHVFQLTRIWGAEIEGHFLCNDQSQCESRDIMSLRDFTVTHVLDSALSTMLVPKQFLQEYRAPGGGILQAPVDMRANDLLLCEFPTPPTTPMA